jgi:hypothetical protein
MPVVGPRFLIEAAFLVAVAVGAGFARLGTVTIILVMAGAWLLMAAVEWMISRAKVRTAGPQPIAAPAEPLEETRQPPAVRTVEPAPVVTGYPAPLAERGEPEPAPAPEPDVTPGPSPQPAPAPEPEAPAEPAPPETPPEQPRVAVVAAVPQPEPAVPEPAPVQPQPPAPAPAAPEPEPTVVAFTPRSLGVPRQWNLWELERVARDQSGRDSERDEERAFLLMYLREFADADGVLPTSFDSIVRESFGDVLDAVGA